MELSLQRLRTLREVARAGGVVAAAEALNYSPSAVSQQLDKLSAEVGAPVLERVGRGVRLTDVGRTLDEQAGVLLAAEQKAIAAIEQARQGLAARLRIGVFPTAAGSLLPAVLEDLGQRFPGIVLESEEVELEDAIEYLSRGYLDLALMLDYPNAPESWSPDLEIVPIGLDEIHLAVPAGSGLGQEVSLAEFADCDWILSGPRTYYGRAMLAACRAAGFEPVVHHRPDGIATALVMVAAGLGVTLASDLGQSFEPPSGVETVRLAERLHRRIVLVQLPHTARRPTVGVVHEAFLHAATQYGLTLP